MRRFIILLCISAVVCAAAALSVHAPASHVSSAQRIHLRNGVIDVPLLIRRNAEAAAAAAAAAATGAPHTTSAAKADGGMRAFLFAGRQQSRTDSPHEVVLDANAVQSIWSAQHAAEQTSPYTTYVAHFKGPISDRALQDVRAHFSAHSAECAAASDSDSGSFTLSLGQYLPHHTWLVRGAAESTACERVLSTTPHLLWFNNELPHEFKADARLLSDAVATRRAQRNTKIFHTAAKSDAAAAERVNIMLYVAGSSDAAETDALLQRWSAAMAAHPTLSGDAVRLERRAAAGSTARVIARVNPSALPDAVSFLAQRREVLTLEPKTVHYLQNKYARFTVQSDVYGNASVWSHGLTGAGQIVSVGDTGVDHDHCFFRDPNVPTPIVPAKPNFNARKIVYYNPIGDGADDTGGHGTHVAGSIAGAAYSSDPSKASDVAWLSDYNGMGVGAKLAVFDFKKVGQGDLLIPDNIFDEYYTLAHGIANTSINSNSWGSKGGTYDDYCIETDRFVAANPGFLPVYAAGNYGDSGLYSLSSPGIAKNALTVGATLSAIESWVTLGRQAGIQVYTPATLAGPYQVSGATFGTPYASADLPSSLSLVIAEPYDGCTALTNGALVSGKAVLIGRNTCAFQTKAENAQAAGALMMIVVDNKVEDLFVMATDTPNTGITLVAVLIGQADGNLLKGAIPSAGVTFGGPISFPDPYLNAHSMATFSSRGPTPDGRIKPDVVAPGSFIISARSDGTVTSNQCTAGIDHGVLAMEGTSMATPVTAGTASLVRQYYVDGYYPTGQPNAANTIAPSAALLKATLIACTAPQTHLGDSSATVTAPPSYYQGFGRLLLEAGLVIAGSNDGLSGHALWVDDLQAASTGSLQSFCFSVTPTVVPHTNPICSAVSPASECMRPFKATLVWSDAPGSGLSSVVLVNNLDLSVSSSASSTVYLGNEHTYDGPGAHTVPEWDVLNNVEVVTIDGSDAAFAASVNTPVFYAVHVRGTNVPVGPSQRYAIVVTGNFVAVPLSSCQAGPSNPSGIVCPNGCSGHGQCSMQSAACNCDAGYTSADCSQNSTALAVTPGTTTTLDVTGTGTVASEAWSYRHFDVLDGQNDHDIQVTLTRTSSLGDPDLYLQLDAFPTLVAYAAAATGCDSCPGAPTTGSSFILPAPVTSGRYYLGVHGFCCDASSYSIHATTDFSTPSKPTVGAKAIMWITISVALILIALAVVAVWYRGRQQARASAAAAAGGQFNASVMVSPPPLAQFSDSAVGYGGMAPVIVPVQYTPPGVLAPPIVGGTIAAPPTGTGSNWNTPLVSSQAVASDSAVQVDASGEFPVGNEQPSHVAPSQ